MIGHAPGRQQGPQQFLGLPQADAHRLADHREALQLLGPDHHRLRRPLLQRVPLASQSVHLRLQRLDFLVALGQALDQLPGVVVHRLPTATGLLGSFRHRPVPAAKGRRRIANPRGDQ